MIIRCSKVRENAKLPFRAHLSDAGADIYYCPKNPDYVTFIQPGQSVLLETGIKLEVPHGFCAEVKNKSGIASKKSLLVGACVIDPAYAGEVLVNLHNVGKTGQTVVPGDRIAQIVVYPIVHPQFEEIPVNKLYDVPLAFSDRQEGSFGSTGEK